jgi:hypothetical protein
MDIKDGHTALARIIGHDKGSYMIDKQHGQAAWICSVDKQHGYAALAWKMDMQMEQK